jgi:DNA-binding LacI/PurR family transcriptional regulator
MNRFSESIHQRTGRTGDGVAATIQEVARLAGVAVGTVSRVLNDNPTVGQQTRARVEAAISELGYRPSPIARNLRRGRTQRVAVLVESFTNPSTVEVMRGLSRSLSGSPYELVLYPVESDADRARHLESLVGPHQADGVVLIQLAPTPEEAHYLREAAVSVLQVGSDSTDFPTVQWDDVRGGELAAGHLLELGHRDIGFIGDDEDNPAGFTTSRDRRLGLARALEAAGVALRPDRVLTGPHGAEPAARLARDLLARSDRPTAVFAASDTQALGVLMAARELELRVPRDLSVLGYDDVDVARSVGLSTISQQLEASGRLAAQLLLADLEAPGATEPRAHGLPLEVVQRGTTAAIPA